MLAHTMDEPLLHIWTCHYLHVIRFFFQCYRPHRDLHSFPTRRSSDLRSSSLSKACCPGSACSRWATVTSPGSWKRRSEEHTSELQSPYDLVCRLLLEKKKKQLPELNFLIPSRSLTGNQMLVLNVELQP